MTNRKKEVETICCFYASKMHLVTMLLPNIDKKINEGVNITTILEEDLEERMNLLLDRLNLKNKEKILKINWKNKKIEEIKNEKQEADYIIINGSKEYIEKVHKILEEKDEKITTLDCYDINLYEESVKEILKEHSKILNTSGEKNKSEYITTIKLAK